jgi:hypothetical protein
MFRLPLVAFLASMLAVGLSAVPARAEMIHWTLDQVGDPGYIPAYTILPSHIGGIDPQQ